MKKVNVMKRGIILGVLLMVLGFVSCNDDDSFSPTLKKKYSVTYSVNSNESSQVLDLWVFYNNKDGKEQNEIITKYPWNKTIEVEAPFNAKFCGKYQLKSNAKIPANVTIAKDVSFKIMQDKTISNSSGTKSKTTISKANYEKYIKTNSNIIKFDFNYEIKK
ncbi:hypothetical protein [Tenacibaculum sp. nBUS_03]|uniref:hypothetical protein n=1 Tax=Tenacibaculum sp. nBUS_03 TaxID=3395320 RepID=UPI003EB8DCF0